MVSLACLGLFILLGIYIWKSSAATPVKMEYYAGQDAGQAGDPAGQETGEPQSRPNTKGNSTNTAETKKVNHATPAKPGAVYGSTSQNAASTTTPSTAQNQIPKTNTTANGGINVPGSKVGDIIKIGDVEMVVTKVANTHKIIDITLTGNTTGQPPKLVLVDQNRIVYEIPAGVDIKVDLKEK